MWRQNSKFDPKYLNFCTTKDLPLCTRKKQGVKQTVLKKLPP